MFGAIIGDMVGSVYEFSGEQVEKDSFSLFNKNSKFTYDTVMSIEVSDAIMRIGIRRIFVPESFCERGAIVRYSCVLYKLIN